MRRITYWLSLALIFTIPFKEIFVLPEIGSVSRVLGLLVAGVWLLAIWRTDIVKRPGVFHLTAFLFFLWNLASVLWSINPDQSLERASTYLRMGIFIWLIWDLFDSRTAIWRGCQAYVLGTWVTTGSLLLNYINNVEAYSSANGRFTATGFNTNETGLLLALALPLAWYLAVVNPIWGESSAGQTNGERPFWQLRLLNGFMQWVNFLTIPLALFSILLTASRGSLIAAAPLLLVMLVTIRKSSLLQRGVLIAGLAAMLTTVPTLIPQQNIDRLSTTSEELSATDLNGRVTVWRDGFETFEEHFIIGVGSGTFRAAVETGKAPHNVFVALAVDIGLIGLLLFLTVLLTVFAALRYQPPQERIVWLSFLLTWLLGSMVGNWEYENVTWLFLCFIVKSAALFVQRKRSQQASLSPVAVDSSYPPAVGVAT